MWYDSLWRECTCIKHQSWCTFLKVYGKGLFYQYFIANVETDISINIVIIICIPIAFIIYAS